MSKMVAGAAVFTALLYSVGQQAAMAAEQLALVENGHARAVIVVQDEPKAHRAAEMIQTYVEKMTRARLSIVIDGQDDIADGATTLFVGHTARTSALGVKIPRGYDPSVRDDAFHEEGYVLRTVDNQIFIAGNNDGPYKGTIYAAAAFLERLGCRWYFPGAWGEIVPQTRTLSVESLDIVSRPDFTVRRIWLSGWIPASAEERSTYDAWAEKIGFNENPYPLVGDGFLGFLLPGAEYFESHPEYFAMDKSGKRMAESYERHTMLCLTNPQVLAQSIENLKAAFAGTRQMPNVSPNGFGISPPDGAPVCFCDTCQSTSQGFRYPMYVHERMTSEEYFSFAAKLAAEFPDKFVATMAYALREMPPQGVELPQNIAVMHAPISCDVLHSNRSPLWRRAEFVKILRQWRQRTPHVYFHEYNPGMLTGFFLPERTVANLADNVPLYKEIGIKGLNNEGRKAFMQTWISYYVTAKLLWDADADVEAIKQDFYTTFFGPDAGPHVQAWFDACEKQLGDAPMQAHEDFLINHIYTTQFVNSIRPHVDAALSANATDEQESRLAVVVMIADHLAAFAEMTDAERAMDYKTAADAAGKLVNLQRRIHQADSFLIDDDPNLVRTYFAEGRKVHFEQQLERTQGAAGRLVAELPQEMRFRRDVFNEGIISQWYASDFNDAQWETRNTFLLWEQQEPPLDDAGHDYDGYGWYRGKFDVPAEFAGKPIRFYCGGAINEAWVWINGKYAGHKKHDLWWSHANDFELEVTNLIESGRPNTITVRVWNDAELGGLHRRGYFWSPK